MKYMELGNLLGLVMEEEESKMASWFYSAALRLIVSFFGLEIYKLGLRWLWHMRVGKTFVVPPLPFLDKAPPVAWAGLECTMYPRLYDPMP